MRIEDRYYADTPHNGGHVFDGALELGITSSATLPVFSANGVNDYSINRTAGGAETIHIVKGLDILRRVIESYQGESAFQQQFNMGAPFLGRPPIQGFPLNPNTNVGNPKVGFQVDSVCVVYRVGVVALTSLALSLAEVKYIGENQAQTVVAIPTTGTPPLTVQANNHVAVFPVTTPGFILDPFSDVQADFTFVMANTGTLRVYGIGWFGHFNYN